MDWTDDAPDAHVPSPVEDSARPSSTDAVDDVDDLDLVELAPIDLPLEAPEADVIDQLRDVPLDDDHDR
jgi:hypothetical protein